MFRYNEDGKKLAERYNQVGILFLLFTIFFKVKGGRNRI